MWYRCDSADDSVLVVGDALPWRISFVPSREKSAPSYSHLQHLWSLVRALLRVLSEPYLDGRYSGSVCGYGLRVRVDAALVSADARER